MTTYRMRYMFLHILYSSHNTLHGCVMLTARHLCVFRFDRIEGRTDDVHQSGKEIPTLPDYNLDDVDHNSMVDSTDARLVLQYAVEKSNSFPRCNNRKNSGFS